MQTYEIGREDFHKMMRQLAPGFTKSFLSTVERQQMETLADKLATATAEQIPGDVVIITV